MMSDLDRWSTDFFRHLREHLRPEIAAQDRSGLAFGDYRVRVEQLNPGAVSVVVADDASGNEIYALDEQAGADPFRVAWLTAAWLKAKP